MKLRDQKQSIIFEHRHSGNRGRRAAGSLRSLGTHLLFGILLVCAPQALYASKQSRNDAATLANYIARLQSSQSSVPTTMGSIWIDSGRMASLSSDYKAAIVGDLITIVVSHNLTSSNAGNVSTARTFNTSSGISSVAGNPSLSNVASLLGLQSSEALSGKSQAGSSSSLATTLTGRVVAVLSSGNLIVEAERVINMNHEKETVVMRGLVRRGDIGPDNTVASSAVGDLELEVRGKGVISNGVRPPTSVLRTILRIINF